MFVSLRSWSRSAAAFSNSCASIADSFWRRVDSISFSSSRVRRRRGHGLDAHPRRRLVDQVDRLVGQEAVGDVAVGEFAGGGEGLVGDLDLVVRLVALAQAPQDLHRLVDRGLFHADLLEAPLERGVALEVLAVLVERGRADRLQLAARERRLEDRGGVDRALGGARADEVVELVDEQDDVAALGDLLHHLLQALLELAPVLGAGDERREVERVDLLVLEQLGHFAARDALRQALDDRRLADAGLAHEHRVVLGAAREDLHDPLDLHLAADHRIELAVGGELGQVAPELVEQARGLLALAGARARARAGGGSLAASAGAGEHADDLVADLLRVRVEVDEDARCDALVLAHEAEQDVLGADVVVAQAQRLSQRELEHLLGARRERDLARGDLLAGAHDPHHLSAHALDGDVEALEHARRKALLLAQQAEEDVLGADVVVLERARLFLSKNDHLAGPLCESLKHGASFLRGFGRGPSKGPLNTRLLLSSSPEPRKMSTRPHRQPLGESLPTTPTVPPGFRTPRPRPHSYPAARLRKRPRAATQKTCLGPVLRCAGASYWRIAGKSTTSRIELCPVRTITRRSMPSPTPPVGGMPCSSASMKSSSWGWVSSAPSCAQPLLGLEALPLHDRVVELREGVRDLHPAREGLPTLHQARVGAVLARERRELERVVEHERRLDQVRLDALREQVVGEREPGQALGGDPHAGPRDRLGEARGVGVRHHVDPGRLLDRLREGHAAPGRREVDLAGVVGGRAPPRARALPGAWPRRRSRRRPRTTRPS